MNIDNFLQFQQGCNFDTTSFPITHYGLSFIIILTGGGALDTLQLEFP